MSPRALAPGIEEALAVIAADAARVDLAALAALVQVMDAIATDERVDPRRCDALARGLDEALGADVARALVDEARCPADIAARFFRLQHLAGLTSTLAEPRR